MPPKWLVFLLTQQQVGYSSLWGCSPVFQLFLSGPVCTLPGPGSEPGFELNVISAVVLGGTRLAGGRGSMIGTVAACLLFATMGNILNLMHADAFVQRVAVGVVLLLALSIEGIRQRMFERSSRRISNVKSEANV